jgi:hypothetical protein
MDSSRLIKQESFAIVHMIELSEHRDRFAAPSLILQFLPQLLHFASCAHSLAFHP